MVDARSGGGGAGRRAVPRPRVEVVATLAVLALLLSGLVVVLLARPGGDASGRGTDAAGRPGGAAALSRSVTSGEDALTDVPTAAPQEVRTSSPSRAGATSAARSTTGAAADAALAEQLAAEREAALRRQARQAQVYARQVSEGPLTVRIGSFNVLGSQHTAPGGMRAKRWPPASTRTPGAAALVADHGVDVLGTQELQADQYRDLTARTGMVGYPGFELGEAETDNSILWDPDVYERVDAGTFTVTFVGRARPQPFVRLADRATGREFWVVNAHLSPGGGSRAGERYRGMATLVSQVRSLRDTGLPVLLTGDMNDRAPFFCRTVVPGGMTASNGGSSAGGCSPPPGPLPVDWVVGSGVDSWSGYRRDTSPRDRRISDHFFISASAQMG